MVLTPEQRAEFLRRNGYDPAQTSYDESTGSVYSGPNTADFIRNQSTPQPGATEPTINPPSTSSFLKVAGKTAFQELGPTAGAMIGGGLAARATAALPPIVGIPASLAAAYYGGKGLQELQNKYVPQSFKNNTFHHNKK
jgi:hypothetical protein